MEALDYENMTPGSALRRQRQHIGWTVDEIANALCLSPDLIRALELNKYDGMGGSTFVLGYLRSYARLVGTNIEDSILKYRNSIPEYVPDPEHIPAASENARRKRSKLDIGLAIAAILVISGIVAVVFFWPSDTTDIGNAEISHEAATPLPLPPSAVVDKPVSSGQVKDALVSGSNVPLELSFSGITPDTRMEAAFGEEESAVVEVPDSPGKHLVLIFEQGSWADVRDAKGSRLLSQTVVKGSSIDLVGEPPFTVFLGNAEGVKVKYLGRIESYSQSKKGLFARFVVGQEP